MTSIVLAAGLSSRMGENKLLIPYRGKTILLHVVETVLPFSDRVLVVTGHDKDKVEEILSDLPVDTIYNPDYLRGQGTSVLCGIRNTDDDFLVVPGDIPLLRKEDVEAVIECLGASSAARAVYKGIPGHPVAFRKENRERLLAYPGPIRKYLDEYGVSGIEASIGTVFDVDTPTRLKALLDRDGDLAVLEESLD